MLTIYTDGSWIPGQDNEGCAGSGVWFGDNDVRNTTICIHEPDSTNQRAELIAIRYALHFCVNVSDIKILTDSQYSINCITTWSQRWLQNGWKNSKGEDVSNQDLIQLILKYMGNRRQKSYATSFEYVRGHHGIHGNEEADKLATSASSMVESTRMKNTLYFYNHNYLPTGQLSNFYMTEFSMSINDRRIKFNCMEQYHHYMKAVVFNDPTTGNRILQSDNPGEQKSLGRSVVGFDKDEWLSKCFHISCYGITAKFKQNPDLLEYLMSTKGQRLAEASRTDLVWGIGISAADSKAGVKWRGQNLLGKALCHVRDTIL